MPRSPGASPWAHLFLVLASIGGCASPGAPADPGVVPDESRLRERVAAFYEAEAAKDWATHHALMLPAAREKTDLTEWTSASGSWSLDIARWQIGLIRRDDRTPALADGTIAAEAVAIVGMDVTTRYSSVEVEWDQTDTWVLCEGEWYWTLRRLPFD